MTLVIYSHDMMVDLGLSCSMSFSNNCLCNKEVVDAQKQKVKVSIHTLQSTNQRAHIQTTFIVFSRKKGRCFPILLLGSGLLSCTGISVFCETTLFATKCIFGGEGGLFWVLRELVCHRCQRLRLAVLTCKNNLYLVESDNVEHRS